MIELRQIPVCDWCGKTKNVTSYYFRIPFRNETEDFTYESIDLCQECQTEAYDLLMAEAEKRASHD